MVRNRELDYLSGFGNFHETEAVAGVLPVGHNAPQKVARGLYAEQLSGTSFLASRYENKRSWLYRILPSAGLQGRFERRATGKLLTSPLPDGIMDPNQMRWDPLVLPEQPTDFIEGMVTFAANGDATAGTGTTIHHYACNRSMEDRFFYDADGELLVVPQTGELRFKTEFGCLEVDAGEICVIPRGVKFTVELMDDSARGYICENHGAMLRLPDLGPIGSNGLANPRDFLAPVADYENESGEFELIAKFQGELWTTTIARSPLDVVAWHGNLYPYKYDLDRFNTIGTVSFDHPDPSIFTVLSSPSDTAGVSNIDFVIFPPRWMVAQDTFRPPYYHRNLMSEYMGLIHGKYDAKPEGFVPGGASLHNCMSAHGPDRDTFEKASNAELKPEYYANTLAFMFESRYPFRVSRFAYDTPLRQRDYVDCWKGLKTLFQE